MAVIVVALCSPSQSAHESSALNSQPSAIYSLNEDSCEIGEQETRQQFRQAAEDPKVKRFDELRIVREITEADLFVGWATSNGGDVCVCV
jgi:hypothetical protein